MQPELNRRTSRRRLLGMASVTVSVAVLFWTGSTVSSLGSDLWMLAAAQSAAPYVALLALLGVALAAAGRSFAAGVLATVSALLFAVVVADRLVSDERPARSQTSLKVMTLNLNQGQADARSVLELAQGSRSDIVVFVELTADSLHRLRMAGIQRSWPHAQRIPLPGSAGLAVFSRWPSRWDREFVRPSRSYISSLVRTPGGTVRIAAVHGPAPRPKTADLFADDDRLERLPPPVHRTIDTIVAGDFNLGLDAARMRHLLGIGYADAAARRGAGYRATWTGLGGVARLTIDHVLVPKHAAVLRLHTRTVRGTDHRALLAEVSLPAR